jgi:hypothetical protein
VFQLQNILCPIKKMTDKRLVFISASYLQYNYKTVPKELMDNAIFFFGSKRFWFFPETREEIIEAEDQPTDYVGMDKEFKELILQKEKQGLLCFLKPNVVTNKYDYGDYKVRECFIF